GEHGLVHPAALPRPGQLGGILRAEVGLLRLGVPGDEAAVVEDRGEHVTGAEPGHLSPPAARRGRQARARRAAAGWRARWGWSRCRRGRRSAAAARAAGPARGWGGRR